MDNAPALPPLLEARGLVKEYPGVRALDGVDMDLRPGEIHALCGENGAGKSTLIKILGGLLPWGSYGGTLRMDGRECRFRGPRDALAAGIDIIHQELAQAPDLTVAENVFLGREPLAGGFLDIDRMQAETARQLEALGEGGIRPDQALRELSVGLRQMVEIARALLPRSASSAAAAYPATAAPVGGRILILDEPTSALSQRESRALLDLVLKLKARGMAVLYISHKLEEVFAIADRITVLRNGKGMGTLGRAEAGQDVVIPLMVGRKLDEVFPPLEPIAAGSEAGAGSGSGSESSLAPLLEVRGWTLPSAVNPQVLRLLNLSFTVRKGEILGIAGLLGAGRTELVESLFGLGPTAGTGEVRIAGKPYRPSSPGHAVARGLALVPEDRRRHGLMLEKTIRQNLTSVCLERFCFPAWGLGQIIDEDRELRQTAVSMRELGVKAPDGEFPVGYLSGGNQQKVVLAKWLLSGPRVLFLDDPTRGVDVGAKAEIYRLIQKLARAGHGVVLISSENEEVLNLSHRILVLRQGRLVAEFAGGEADPETIVALCAGGAPS